MSGKKKLLAALMCLLLLCALCLPALAEKVTVKYIEYTWDGKKLTSEEKTCTATKLTGDEETLSTGWYVAADTLTYDSRLSVSGDVRLILADGCTVNANAGITVNEGTAEDGKANSLSIYAQREDEGMGALTVSGQNNYDAGIGGTGGDDSGGSVTIKGGCVSAVNTIGDTGIGGDGCTVSLGWKDADDYITATRYTGNVELAKSFLIEGTGETLPAGSANNSKIAGKRLLPNCVRDVKYVEYTWDGEKLTRRVKTCAAAKINGDEATLSEGWYVAMENVTFSGRPVVSGNVGLILADGIELKANAGITVEGDNTLSIFAQREGEGMGALTVSGQGDDAGIGGTSGKSSGLITIHGGKIEAAADDWGAGIGGGYKGNGKVTIQGGTVSATAKYGAGIGGGAGGNGEVTIHGGAVTATASRNGAGIGGGTNGSGKVTISGGTVSATAKYGAGIGGGRCLNGQGGNGEVEISGGTVTATASGKGAAIGNGWYGSDGSVTITGGSVSAVHTTQSSLSIGGDLGECTVSLGLTKKNDSVYAAGYAAKDNTVTLTAALQDAGSGRKFPEEGDDPTPMPAGIAADKLARKLLIPDTEEAARQQAWNDKAVTFRLPGSLTGIGSGAFQNIRAATVLVPQTVKKIGPDAFRGSGVKRIKFENGNPETFDASAFADCPFVIVYTPAQGKVYETLKDKANVYLMPVK